MNPTNHAEADLIIEAAYVIPVTPRGQILRDHALVVNNKRITGIVPSCDISNCRAKKTINLPNHVLMPGFVNAHGHISMSLFRGLADDIPLQEWLETRIWPLESKYVDREFVRDGAMLALAEMISTGTTCFADMYFYADEVAGVAHESNMRAQLASPVLDFPTAWAQNADEYINKATQIHDDYRSNDLISTAFGPHAPYTVSDEPLTRIAALAEELDVPIHMHLHENAQEVTDAEATDGRRPLQRLRDLGIVSPRLLCVHATQLLPEEITLLATHGASVIHCPSSNMKLASGFCKVDQLLRQGVNVALGTDGAASNNDLDMFGEMHLMAMIAKAVAQDAAAVNAQQALEIATLNGAKALGLDNEIGSLEIGKYADVCAVSLAPLSMTPVNNPLSHLVYASNGSYVSHVWVGGTPLLTDGELQTLDLALIRDRAQYWQGQFSSQ